MYLLQVSYILWMSDGSGEHEGVLWMRGRSFCMRCFLRHKFWFSDCLIYLFNPLISILT